MSKNSPQHYPRISDESSKHHGYLDESALVTHHKIIAADEIRAIVMSAIENANRKSGRVILNIPEGSSIQEVDEILKRKGKELFHYFQRYCGDPASTAYACINRHYQEIAREQFRNWTLQKERMNSGWRYQYIAKDAAIRSQRFISVSDIGTAEADFNAVIGIKASDKHISIYVSVKNRVNTMGGQDWPKAIRALEEVAKNDKNRMGAYLCVFGIAMDRGDRLIKTDAKTRSPFSVNTELWKSDFFWPFFTNLSYDEIVKAVLAVLLAVGEKQATNLQIPEKLITAFGENCQLYQLVDTKGYFNDPYRLVDFFCGKLAHGKM